MLSNPRDLLCIIGTAMQADRVPSLPSHRRSFEVDGILTDWASPNALSCNLLVFQLCIHLVGTLASSTACFNSSSLSTHSWTTFSVYLKESGGSMFILAIFMVPLDKLKLVLSGK